jgi:ubiquinol-cytochrome c reductase cytochrome b subunit
MWLFQLLTYFSGSWEPVGSLALPAFGVALLFAVPFLGKGKAQRAADRPLALAAGVSCVIAIVYLTLMGFAGARPYGKEIPVPARQLTASEQRGVYLFADRDCAYCHQIGGRGGHRTGPDLANTISKDRSREYIARYVKNPQAISRTSIMPKYNLPDADLHALADFVLALDFRKYSQTILKRSEVLKSASLQSHEGPADTASASGGAGPKLQNAFAVKGGQATGQTRSAN